MGQIVLTQQATPNTPPAGSLAVYNDTNNNLAYMTSAGAVGGLMNGKNRIINGDMRVNQRNPTASGATAINGTFMADRFRTELSYDGTPTWTYDPDVPTNAQAGRTFKNSLKFISTQDATIAAGQFVWLWQRIEGHNIVDILGDGYNNGFTLSFWVKSSTAGIYCVCFSNSGRDRNYPVEYIINTANTWEKKSITVTSAPASGGTWDSSTGCGLYLQWILCCGTTYSTGGVSGSWNSLSTPIVATTNQVNFAASATNNFWLTGVQLEAGPVATPFEHRSITQEIALCQRYYYRPKSFSTTYLCAAMCASASLGYGTIHYPVTMRIPPTFLISATGDLFCYDSSVSMAATAAPSLDASSNENIGLLPCSGAGGMTQGRGAYFYIGTGATKFCAFDAEM
jgi:hypothetical protein